MIKPIRTLLDLRTPLRLIPRAWLELVEPKITRLEGSSCWLWDGAVDRDGEPVLAIKNLETGSRGSKRVKRIVAALFWDLKDHYDVSHACKNVNCLNPQHFHVSDVHWRQENRPAIINKRAQSIRRWGKLKNA